MKFFDEETKEFLLESLIKNSAVVNKYAPEARLLEKAQDIVVADDNDPMVLHKERPYITTTQNQRYLTKAVPANAKKACVILGAGDTLFQLLSQGVTDITALDRNELQILMYYLRMASIKTLEANEFESFVLDINHDNFLSSEIFSKVIAGFEENQILERNFWKTFLDVNPKEDLIKYYIKGGLEQSDLYRIRYCLPYLKKKSLYYGIREKVKNAKINIQFSDALEYLNENDEEKFDYIDITNILLLMFQLECNSDQNEFVKVAERLRKIYDVNLKTGGTFVLDYMFGMDAKELFSKEEIKFEEKEFENGGKGSFENFLIYQENSINFQKYVYRSIYKVLNDYFDLETFQVEAGSQATALNNPMDTIILTKKAK